MAEIPGEQIGTARIDVVTNAATMDPGLAAAKSKLAAFSTAAQNQYTGLAAADKKVFDRLNRRIDLLGKSAAARAAYDAQVKIGGALGAELAQKAIAQEQALGAAIDANTDKFAVSAQEHAAQEARYAAVMQAERAKAAEAEAARAAAAQARAEAITTADASEFAAFNATVRAKQLAMVQLNAAMASGLTTRREVAAAEDAIDAAMAAGALTESEQVTYLDALNAAEARIAKAKLASAEATGIDTASLEANTAAIKLNARTQYELGVLGGEVASGNISRIKRSIPALLNATGTSAKLMSPAGLAVIGGAASIGALIIAYVQAERESANFTRALYATGQQGLATADQLQALATKVGEATGDYGDSAKALNLLVSSGKYTQDQFELLSRTLVNFASLTGGSLQSGMQAIDSLTGEVGDGLVKLNSQYHFLTDTVYEQIAALQAQGQTEKARDLERKAFSDGINESADQVKAHLDPLAQAWDSVATAASSAWHAMGEGARQGADKAIGAIEGYFSDLKDLASRVANPMATVMNGGLSPREVANNQANDPGKARAEAFRRQATQTLAEFGAEAGKFRSAAEKRAAEIIRVTQQTNDGIAKALAAGDKELADKIRASGAKLEEEIAAHGAPKPKASHGKTSDDYLASAQDALSKMVQRNVDATLKQGGAYAKAQMADAAYTDQLKQQLATRKDEIALQVASIGMGQKEYQQYSELNQVYKDFDRQLAQLNRQRDAGNITLDQYNRRLSKLKQNESDTIDAMVNGFKEADAARASWQIGVTAAMTDWINQGQNVAAMTAQTFTDAFGSMNDALVNFVKTGKLDFSQLADSIISDLVRMELRVAESKILTSVLGGATATSFDSNGTFFSFAKGGVFDSPSLSRYSGGVYDSPRLFKFASGGVFGEAGPEAIMPLSRGPDGKLGVKAGGSQPISLQINLKNESGQALQAKQQGQASMSGNKIMADFVLTTVATDVVKGGSTAKAMQQRFGLSRAGVPVGA